MRSSIHVRAVHRHSFGRRADRVARSPRGPRPPRPTQRTTRAPGATSVAISAARPARRGVSLVPVRTAGGRGARRQHLRWSLRGEPRRCASWSRTYARWVVHGQDQQSRLMKIVDVFHRGILSAGRNLTLGRSAETSGWCRASSSMATREGGWRGGWCGAVGRAAAAALCPRQVDSAQTAPKRERSRVAIRRSRTVFDAPGA
jgi:hypothetical protein